jgi:hypothetical protein
MQAIMIARLHAMYQRRKMLMVLSIILLAVTIANVVTITIITIDMLEGKLYSRMKDLMY